MSKKLQLPIEEITVQHVIDELTPMDVGIRENQKQMQNSSSCKK